MLGRTARSATAAGRWLELLEDSQRQRAVADFPGEPERSRWFYVPTDHGGLALADSTPVQRQAALRLLATGLSPAGYNLAAAVMGHEPVLARLDDWPVLPGWGPVRDPQRYYVIVFGDPESGEWGWRFAGHHLSLHYTITGGELASATPSFFGADPAEAPLPGGGLLRPCGALEDLGRDLARSLDERQLGAAKPDQIVATKPLSLLWHLPGRGPVLFRCAPVPGLCTPPTSTRITARPARTRRRDKRRRDKWPAARSLA